MPPPYFLDFKILAGNRQRKKFQKLAGVGVASACVGLGSKLERSQVRVCGIGVASEGTVSWRVCGLRVASERKVSWRVFGSGLGEALLVMWVDVKVMLLG